MILDGIKQEYYQGFIDSNTQYTHSFLKASGLNTPLGPMLVIADQEALYLLEFVDCRDLEGEIRRLQIRTQSAITQGTTQSICSIESELNAYFDGTLKEFKTPFFLFGTTFQKSVWQALMTIPCGETRSYADQAKIIGKPSACRAVANANGANQIALVIPCHRIIASDGTLGGYGGGVARKQWLIDHERKN